MADIPDLVQLQIDDPESPSRASSIDDDESSPYEPWSAPQIYKPLSPYRNNKTFRDATTPGTLPPQSLSYEYKPLPKGPWIRLLKLKPDIGGPIRCSLVTVNLDDEQLTYEALSYTWGEPWALNRYRWIWADAICINQKDDEEKSYQLQLLRKIYARAHHTLIWLGDAADQTIRAALKGVCQIFNEHGFTNEFANPISYLDGAAAFTESYTKKIPPMSLDVYGLRTLAPLFSCEWFRRMWVFQEAVSSRPAYFYWGDCHIEFEYVAKVADLLYTDYYEELRPHQRATVGVFSCSNMYRTQHGECSHFNFVDFLSLTRTFNVTRPEDRVWALIGIATCDTNPKKEDFFIQPDTSLPAYEVFKRVARKSLIEQQTITPLIDIEWTPHSDDSSPVPEYASWVPTYEHSVTMFFSNHGAYRANGDKAAVIYSSECGRQDCLTITGIEIDTIASVTRVDPARDQVHSYSSGRYRRLQQIVKNLLQVHTADHASMILTAGLEKPEDQALGTISLWAFLDYNLQNEETSDGDIIEVPPESADSGTRMAYRKFVSMTGVLDNRSIFATEKEVLGLEPDVVKGGDLVVLFGSEVPFVLRPTSEESHYQVMGPCYVHTIMDGHAVHQWGRSRTQAEKFHVI